jgi:hypothetical protein
VVIAAPAHRHRSRKRGAPSVHGRSTAGAGTRAAAPVAASASAEPTTASSTTTPTTTEHNSTLAARPAAASTTTPAIRRSSTTSTSAPATTTTTTTTRVLPTSSTATPVTIPRGSPVASSRHSRPGASSSGRTMGAGEIAPYRMDFNFRSLVGS